MTTRIFALLTCAAVVYSASSAVLARTTTVTVVSESSSLLRRQGDEGTIAKRGRVAANEAYMAPAQGEEGYYVHIGCFADKSSDRVVLGMKLVKVDMGAKVCHDYCNAQGAFYMATKNGNECYCSTADDIDYIRLNTGVCDQSCAGDESERCGGNNAFDLYELVWPDEPTSHEYVGCYADNVEERVMSDQYISDYMTSTVCRDYCEGKDALYYATKFGDECWCGLSDTFADYERYGMGTCHMRCPGDQSEACGGHQAFSLYRFIDDRPLVALKTELTPETLPEMIIDHLLELDSADSIKGEDEEAATTPRQLGSDPYDGSFTGDGTYYGTTSDGNCAIRSPIPSMYDGMIPVALNSAQYGDSEMCGACIEGEGSGKGSFKAYVMDKCPECSYGDLDFSESGDGRWDISWKFVSCPGGSSKPSFIFEGSNEYYWKIQPRGTKTPVVELKVDGVKGSKTDDNFFEIPGAPYPLDGAQTVETKTMSGETSTQKVSC